MNTDVCNYMFGSILAMSADDVRLSVILGISVVLLFILFYNRIFAVTFDEPFASATGTRTRLYNMIIAFLTAITIVLGMRMMGALLISSLIVFPSLTAMQLCRQFKTTIILSSVSPWPHSWQDSPSPTWARFPQEHPLSSLTLSSSLSPRAYGK